MTRPLLTRILSPLSARLKAWLCRKGWHRWEWWCGVDLDAYCYGQRCGWCDRIEILDPSFPAPTFPQRMHRAFGFSFTRLGLWYDNREGSTKLLGYRTLLTRAALFAAGWLGMEWLYR